MKPIKKFSTEMNQPKSILESLDSKALDELIKGMGFKDVHELKREKNLLSKLEALLKEVNPKQNISEDDAEDIEDDINKKGEPKSLEDLEGKKEPETPIGKPEEIKEDESDDHEETEEESDEDENGKEDSNKTEVEIEVEVEDSDKEEESVSTPKATRRIMTFEDFIQEETVNKNVSYRDDEDEEDEALPVADSKETDIEVEENANVQTKTAAVKSFSQFVSEAVADLGPELKDEELIKVSDVFEATKTTDKDAEKVVKSIIKSNKNFRWLYDDLPNNYTLVDVKQILNDAGYGQEYDKHVKENNVFEGEINESHFKVGDQVKSFSQFVSEAVADLGPELKDEEIDYEGAIVVPVAKGDGPKTADEIEEEEVEAGKPKPRDEKEGEVLVTVDQEITEDPETSDDEPETFGTVVSEATTVPLKNQETLLRQQEKHFASFLKPKKLNINLNNGVLTVSSASGNFTITVDSNNKTIDGTGKPKWPESTSYVEIFGYLERSTGYKVLNESMLNEAEVKSDEDFKEYAFTVLQNAFGDEFDEAKAQELVDGLTSKYSGDYGAMVGALKASLSK